MSPHLGAVRVERVWVAGGVVRIAACTRELTVACPDCGRGSARVHSRCGRKLADVAVGGRPVVIGLSVRRLFCDTPDCGRRTFAEQVDGLTARYQRPTPLLQHLVEMAGVLLAGRGGARLLQILTVPLSRTSVLFHSMRLPLPSPAIPRVLGVDDFALYADVCGTLLVDADTRLPSSLFTPWVSAGALLCLCSSLQGLVGGIAGRVGLGASFLLRMDVPLARLPLQRRRGLALFFAGTAHGCLPQGSAGTYRIPRTMA
jgi:hypothetical protein